MSHTHKPGSASGRNKGRLRLVFLFTSAYLVAEVVGAFLTSSLALLADAGHMLTDVAGLALALFAIHFGERPATPERTYGYYRLEILAAVANAIVLIAISFYILYEAYQRFRNPPEVASGPMLVVAVIGLAVNIAGMLLLRNAAAESLNMKGAYYEVLSDMLTSIGVIVAAVIMLFTGRYWVDPLISAGIGLFILPRTWSLLREAVGVLLEGTPSSLNLETVRQALADIGGVESVHDLHAWSLTSGMNALSAHLVLGNEARHHEILSEAQTLLRQQFSITHATLQIEPLDWEQAETHR